MLTKGKLSRCVYFFLFSLGVICGVEIIQFLTFTGSLDIDDLILNLTGACGAFLLMKTKPLKKLYE
jgi:glycopeptide antibiotics resistance protein